LSFSFIDWTEVSGICGTFSYSVSLSGGAALPAYITYSSLTFTVSTSNLAFAGDYII
jgi:hypothetical protein